MLAARGRPYDQDDSSRHRWARPPGLYTSHRGLHTSSNPSSTDWWARIQLRHHEVPRIVRASISLNRSTGKFLDKMIVSVPLSVIELPISRSFVAQLGCARSRAGFTPSAELGALCIQNPIRRLLDCPAGARENRER